MTFTINKQYSKTTIKAPRNSASFCPKLSKTSKRLDKHCCGITVVITLTFKNVRRRKKVYTKCKSEKYFRQIHHPVTDLKMELLAKIVSDFKL